MEKAGRDFIFCGNCGEKCKLPAKFCGVCGYRINPKEWQSEGSVPTYDDEPTELLLDPDEDRTLLLDPVEEALPLPVIIRVKTNEMTVMGKQRFRMGASKYDNELMVKDNPFVSRWHAEIVARDGNYYLKDKNSKNKTFVDGVALAAGQEVVLVSGNRFKLADEEFIFEIE